MKNANKLIKSYKSSAANIAVGPEPRKYTNKYTPKSNNKHAGATYIKKLKEIKYKYKQNYLYTK
jgi:hypothetical protein